MDADAAGELADVLQDGRGGVAAPLAEPLGTGYLRLAGARVAVQGFGAVDGTPPGS